MTTTSMTSTGRKGDLRIAFGFKKLPDRPIPEGVLYLFRAHLPQVMVDIPACEMHRFDERDRDPVSKEPRCLPLCGHIAEMLYGMPTKDGASRVLSAISEWMTDVKNLPPAPTSRSFDEAMLEMRKRGYDFIETVG